jgi:hypothetical protein
LSGRWPFADDPDQYAIHCPDPETGKLIPKLVPTREKQITLPDGRKIIRVVIDELDQAEIPKIVQRVRRRAGLTALSKDELAIEVQRSEREMIGNRPILITPKFDMLAYKRGMLKIAYELAWLWIGDDWLSDAAAVRLRNAILEPNRDFTVHGVRGTVSPGADFAPWQSEPDCHIGAAMRDGDQITLSVRVFSAVSAVVLATEEAWRYPDFGILGQFIALDPVTRQITRQTTLSAEMERLFPRPTARP